jgi:hypothetical protein
LLWISIILFAIWIAYIAVVQAVTAGFWILLAFAVAFLIVAPVCPHQHAADVVTLSCRSE